MPTPIPTYVQAKDVMFCTLAPGTLGAGGLTFGTAVDIGSSAGLATFKGINFNFNPVHGLFMASDQTVANYAIEYDDPECTIEELIPKNGVGNNLAAALAYDYVKVAVGYKMRGLAGAGVQVVYAGVRGGLPWGVKGGENTSNLTLKACGIAPWSGLTSATPPF